MTQKDLFELANAEIIKYRNKTFAKVREELIKDILTYLEEKELNYSTIENDITQIIVDTFDEYELNNKGK